MIYIVHYNESSRNEMVDFLRKKMGINNIVFYDLLYFKMINPIRLHDDYKPEPLKKVLDAFSENFNLLYVDDEFNALLDSYYDIIDYKKLSSLKNTKEEIIEFVCAEIEKSPKCIQFYIEYIKRKYQFKNTAILIENQNLDKFNIVADLVQQNDLFNVIYSGDIKSIDIKYKKLYNFLAIKNNKRSIKTMKSNIELITL